MVYLYSAHRAVIFAIAQLSCTSQGSVAAQLGFGGMFSNHFITNFPQNASVKKFRELVNTWQKYGQGVAYFFGPPCIYSANSVIRDSLW